MTQYLQVETHFPLSDIHSDNRNDTCNVTHGDANNVTRNDTHNDAHSINRNVTHNDVASLIVTLIAAPYLTTNCGLKSSQKLCLQ